MTSQLRMPVVISASTNDGSFFVACDDGSLWVYRFWWSKPEECYPIPGTARAIEKKADDPGEGE